ncbi:zinc-finger domain-containing protein [Marinicella sediminis]|uniref:Zinc-finger domain-containing protein n=1 Tax=Marinicella sediminis TaxID=1792834 RepID=A0ABV7J8J6_9GAMM|nr:zinc-finger domain-containing protein [Marinicella sediminis]
MNEKAANTQKVYHVKQSDLPISCPTKEMAIWNSHPKVYLPIEKTGEAVCEYCGAKFILDTP